MWSSEVNANTAVDNFAVAVETDTVSKGSWELDYEAFCEKFKIIRCPFIKATALSNESESCRIMNSIVDLSNWRAMLLACCTAGSKVIEISVHGARLEPQHLVDLSTALKKMGTCRSLKLQYLDWQDGAGLNEVNTAQYQEAFASVIGEVGYASLKGNNFNDDFIMPVLASLSQNFKLNLLNLSSNQLTDQSLRVFLKAVRCTTNIKTVSFESNRIAGEALSVLGELFLGSDFTAEDDATIKGNSKLVGERNKQIKEVNKKRKKANIPELKEITPSLDCSVKKEKTLVHANRSLQRLDLSNNPTLQVESLNALVQTLVDTAPLAALPAAASGDVKLVVELAATAALPPSFNFNPQPWFEFVA